MRDLFAISPIDGRYAELVSHLENYFSEAAEAKARILVEIAYLIALSETGVIRRFTEEEFTLLKALTEPTYGDLVVLKKIEGEVRHDTKAVEYYLKERFQETLLVDLSEFIHFGLTSTDVDNLAFGILFDQALKQVLLPTIKELINQLAKLADEYKGYPMLGRTHGQPAVPTTLGKELVNFAVRLHSAVQKLDRLQIPGKLTGAVGNFNAHKVAFPEIDWISFSAEFVASLGLSPKVITTQIPPYEDLCEIFDCLRRINSIVIGLDRDLWDYLSRGCFTLTKKDEEVGSSTMPQKVNPIDFERSEAYLKVANALFEMLTRELPINRLQRDLTDKYLLRVVGEAVAYSLVSWQATIEGLNKIRADKDVMMGDLLEHWEVLAEGIQTILRKHGYPMAYEELKGHVRGKTLDFLQYRHLVQGLMPKIPKEALDEVRKLHPLNYLGEAITLTEKALDEMSRSTTSGTRQRREE